MPYQDKNRQKLRGIFPVESQTTDKEKPKNGSPAVFSTAGQFYAIASEGEVVKRFELLQSSGKRYSFSYSLLPVCIQADSATLYIKAYELLITIVGRNIEPIHEHFTNEVLVWAKASPSGKDDGLASTFIKEITVEGEAVKEDI